MKIIEEKSENDKKEKIIIKPHHPLYIYELIENQIKSNLI